MTASLAAPPALDALVPDLAGTGALAGVPHVRHADVAAMHAAHGAAALHAWFDAVLAQHGALLVRGVPAAVPADLEALLGALMPPAEFAEYEEDRVSPRSRLGAHTYTSSEWHSLIKVPLHNECGARLAWPMRIMFFCRLAAATGGETPFSRVRDVTAALPADLAAEFAARGLRYVRNLSPAHQMPVAETFGTTDREAIAAYCARNAMAIEWLTAEHARLTLVRPAFAVHPATGETLWFNNLQMWSRANWDRAHQVVTRGAAPGNLPFHTTFGDGQAIPPAAIAAVAGAYQAARVEFPWQANDLLLLDNMLCAHGRNRFSGQRDVWTVMARMHAAAPASLSVQGPVAPR